MAEMTSEVKNEIQVTKRIAKRASKRATANTQTLKKNLSSAKKIAKKAQKKNVTQDAEIAKLKAAVEALKNKKSTRGHVSEYNLFIRKQILSGLTFTQAVKEWNRYKLLQSKNTRRPSAYNQFIGSQMRLGKTFTQAVKLWNLAKAGKLGKKGSTRTVTRTVVRRITSKPKVVIKRVRSRPTIVTKVRYRNKKVVPKKTTRRVRIVRSTMSATPDYAALREMISSSIASASTSSTTTKTASQSNDSGDEHVAFRLVETYFKEIARTGFKKQLTLDEIINAYLYSLAKVKRSNTEWVEADMKKSGMTK